MEFSCQECGKHYCSKANLDRHKKNVHDKIKNAKCEFCDFVCSQKSNLLKHKCYRNAQDTGELESDVQHKLWAEVGGDREDTCDYGRVDIKTESEIIEIKRWSDHKKAIGHILGYAVYNPNHKKRIHFFGRRPPNVDAIMKVCTFYGIKVTESS